MSVDAVPSSDHPRAVFNPHNVPEEDLPIIYGWNNGGSPGWYSATAMAEDGKVLGSHVCSDDIFVPHDLGLLEGSRLDRHKDSYEPHYSDGYRMVYVKPDEAMKHEGLKEAAKRSHDPKWREETADAEQA